MVEQQRKFPVANPDYQSILGRRDGKLASTIQLIILACFYVPLMADADVYKCTGSFGETIFSDKPCGTDQERMEITPAPISKSQKPSSGLRPAEQQRLDSIQADEEKQKIEMREEMERQLATPKDVLGTIVLIFSIQDEYAKLPPNSIEVTLVTVSQDGTNRFRKRLINNLESDWSGYEAGVDQHSRGEGHFNFLTSLPSGKYRFESVEIKAKEIGNRPVTLPVYVEFQVPAEVECVYIGRVVLPYHRLAAGRSSEQRKGRQLSKDFVYVRSGGFIPLIPAVDIPELDERVRVRLGKELYQEALQRDCMEQPAHLANKVDSGR